MLFVTVRTFCVTEHMRIETDSVMHELGTRSVSAFRLDTLTQSLKFSESFRKLSLTFGFKEGLNGVNR